MRSRLTKTIILIVFVVFLGINDVNAETCTYSAASASSRMNQLYILETDSTGKVVSIYYKVVDIQTDVVMTEIDYTNQWSVDFVGCPASIGQDGNRLTASKSTYLNVDRLKDSNSQGSDYVGSLSSEDTNNLVSCGEITDIPKVIPNTTKIIYILLQIFIPVVLVVLGMLDLIKGITAQKEDEIKRGQQTLVKRLIAAAIVFFVFSIVKMVATYLAENSTVGECLNCFIKGNCSENDDKNGNDDSTSKTSSGRPNVIDTPY